MQLKASYSTNTGFHSSSTGVPTRTVSVHTSTPVGTGSPTRPMLSTPKPGCPAGTVPVPLPNGIMTCVPASGSQAARPACPPGTIPVPLPNGIMTCVPPAQSSGDGARSQTQASSLKRYALWGAIGLVGAIVVYKLVK